MKVSSFDDGQPEEDQFQEIADALSGHEFGSVYLQGGPRGATQEALMELVAYNVRLASVLARLARRIRPECKE